MVGEAPTQHALHVRRARGNGGQTTVEWLAMMAAIVALCAALTASLPSVAATITDRVACLISTVAGDSGCTATPRQGGDRSVATGGKRRIYDADGNLIRETGDEPSATRRPTPPTTTSAASTTTTAAGSAATPTTTWARR